MTSLFAHPPFAEDQTRAHEILYLHVIRAAAMTGSFVSLFTAPASLLASRYRNQTPFNLTNLTPRLLKHSARGIVLGSVFGAVATWGRMRGREEIEWQDRSWRLLENEGEVNTDWWMFDGAVAGAAVGVLAARRGKVPGGLGLSTAGLGGAGLGANIGTGYMFASYANGRKPA